MTEGEGGVGVGVGVESVVVVMFTGHLSCMFVSSAVMRCTCK